MAHHPTPDETRTEIIDKLGPILGPIYHELLNEFLWLSVKWQEYRKLFGTSPEQIDLLNEVAGMFFGIVQDALWDDTLLHLCRLTDKSDSGTNKLNLTILALPPLIAEATLKELVCKSVNNAVAATQFARDWRNRQISHSDLALALNGDAKTLAQASRAQVSEALSAIHDVLNIIHISLFDSPIAREVFSPSTGAEALLRAIQDGLDAAEARRT